MTSIVLIGMVFVIIREIFHVKVSLNSVLLLLLVNFVIEFRLEFLYASLIVNIRTCPWFSAGCAVVIVHRNHFFCLYQQKKSSEPKVKFRQARNCCKRVLEASKLAFVTKTKESNTSWRFRSQNFWGIANSVFNKGKSTIPPFFNGQEVLSSACDKTKLFVKNSILEDSGVSLPVFHSGTNLKLHNTSVKWLKW